MNSSISNVNDSDTVPLLNNDDWNNPLWRYVKRVEKKGDGGGNVSWECNFCHEKKQGTYTRVRAHLLKIPQKGIASCKKVKSCDMAEMRSLEEEAKKRLENLAPRKVSLPHSPSATEFDFKKRKTHAGESSSYTIDKAFKIEYRNQLHAEIARMFYTAGMPFNIARNPYYVSSFKFAANHMLSGYVPPSYNALRSTLLTQEKSNVERLLEPIKFSWREKGVSIVSDGWSDSQRRPLINFIAISDSGPMFLKAVDCSDNVKDKYFIAELMKEVINEVGHDNVVQVITDNARNCKGAGEIIEGLFPHIYWTPCVVHTLNLALKNICAAKNIESNWDTYKECSWITDIHGDAIQIKNFIMNHSMRLAIFNRFVPLKLLSIAETRFASVIVMLKRFKHIKRGLQSMVISEAWTSYREDDLNKAMFVKDKILDDFWWDQIDYILSFTEPIYDMIRVCDTDKPCLHLVYEMWDSMIEKVKTVIYKHEGKRLNESSSFWDVVYIILIDRWTKNNTPLHCLAHSLNPRYYNDKWLSEDSSRVPPHKDAEISKERTNCFKRFFPDFEDRTRVNTEFANFSLKMGDFADSDSLHNRYNMEAKCWWAIHGASAPLLQKIAFKLLGQPSSSSCCERNWSTYSFVNSVRRSKLTPKRAEDLVFIHNNLRLLSRRNPQYYVEQTKMWDLGGDEFGSFEDIGILEIANLSLDEPEMEAMYFMNDMDGDKEEDDELQVIGSN